MTSSPSDGVVGELDRFREEWRREVQERLKSSKEAPEPPPIVNAARDAFESSSSMHAARRRAPSVSATVADNLGHAAKRREVPEIQYSKGMTTALGELALACKLTTTELSP